MKKRFITQEINYDEEFDSLSANAQLLFLKFLSISDDCGVIPGNEFTLFKLVSLPQEITRNYSKLLKEILGLKLMFLFDFNGKKFLCFKKHSFEAQQKFLIKNRTKSEYLRISVAEFEDVYRNLQEIPVNYIETEYNLYKDIRLKIKDKDKEGAEKILKEFNKFWDMYDYKVGSKEKLIKKWKLISEENKEKIFSHVPDYVSSTPDKKFRKHPGTYLNNESWNDEIVKNNQNGRNTIQDFTAANKL